MAKKTIWVPFRKRHGNCKSIKYDMQSFDDGWYSVMKLVDHYRKGPWQDSMVLTGYGRGRSAVTFEWTSTRTKSVYVMTLGEFMDIILNSGEYGCRLDNGKYRGMSLLGWFTFMKKGTALGIKYLGRHVKL